MKTNFLLLFTISVFFLNCSTSKKHRFVSFVFLHSRDTLQLENITEYKDHYVLQDNSKIEKSKILWSRIDEKKIDWKEERKKRKKKQIESMLKVLF